MKAKILQYAVIYLLSFGTFFFFWKGILDWKEDTEVRYRYEMVVEVEPKVYVTTYGEKYHHKDCTYLKSVHEKGLYEAKKEGYTACSRCHGQSSGSIEVEYKKEIAYATKKNNKPKALYLAFLFGSIPCCIMGLLRKRNTN